MFQATKRAHFWAALCTTGITIGLGWSYQLPSISAPIQKIKAKHHNKEGGGGDIQQKEVNKENAANMLQEQRKMWESWSCPLSVSPSHRMECCGWYGPGVTHIICAYFSTKRIRVHRRLTSSGLQHKKHMFLELISSKTFPSAIHETKQLSACTHPNCLWEKMGAGGDVSDDGGGCPSCSIQLWPSGLL